MQRFERRNAPFALKIQVIEADCCFDPDAVERIEHERQGNDIYGGVEMGKCGWVLVLYRASFGKAKAERVQT
jgi:hypothetical protein